MVHRLPKIEGGIDDLPTNRISQRGFDFDPFTAEGITRAEVEGRKKLPELLTFLRDYVPGAENAQLIGSGPTIGIRESRRITADYGRIESGQKGCSVDILVRLAGFYETSLDYLVLGTEGDHLSQMRAVESLKSDVSELIDHLTAFASKLQ